MDSCTVDEEFVSVVREMFTEKVPFNKALGIKVESISYESVQLSFEMRDDLVGNFMRGMLHGGVIASVIDSAGGLVALMGTQKKLHGKTLEARAENFGKGGTIDLRVDYLRPGIGKWFVATAHALRTGNKVVAVRMEMHNDQNDLIAVGAGSYFVG